MSNSRTTLILMIQVTVIHCLLLIVLVVRINIIYFIRNVIDFYHNVVHNTSVVRLIRGHTFNRLIVVHFRCTIVIIVVVGRSIAHVSLYDFPIVQIQKLWRCQTENNALYASWIQE